VRTNIYRLIGGATEETIIARVGEGIVSAIGSADTHAEVLENPDRITKTVLDRRLDSQTAYEIVSIDIADIDVGENIGARLQADQAEADTRVARAKAEEMRLAVKEIAVKHGGETLRFTCSFGVASYDPEHCKVQDSLVSLADHAVYMAKQGGRDQVRCFTGDLVGLSSAPTTPTT
jgi:GGDEF domain-containing protein